MELKRATSLKPPAVLARFAPVYWEPMPGSGEKICAILLLVPESTSTLMLAPAAHVVINARRLKAMLGAERGESALGILKAAAEFMTRRLYAGADISEAQPPFQHFSVGKARPVKGFTPEQVLDAAVQLSAAFGSSDDLLDDIGAENNHSTATTREFLARVQTAFSPPDDERRKRFLKRVPMADGQQVTIDYAHQMHLVQFATSPTTIRQAQNMKREAEAKILEALTVQHTLMEQRAKPQLFINTAPLHIGGLSTEGLNTAHATMAHYATIARIHGFDTMEVSSHEEAVLALAALN